MSGALPRLGRATAGSAGPAPAAGLLHLGLGNFHRAHQAVYTGAAIEGSGGDWGIVGVASRSRAVVDALHAQDLRYAVAEISPVGMSLSVPRVHVDAFVAADDPDRVLRSVADPAIRVVTLTVTENGYRFSASTRSLDLADASIAADLQGGAPQTTIGQLARGLQARAAGAGDPITILSCDNLAANGAQTELLVRDFLQALPGAEGDETLAFLDQSVSFPSSMVDRIVPATTARLRADVATRLGAWDEVPVPAEPFTMWAIEDRFAAGRPAWEAGGAVFTDEVGRYEQMKVRLLNGTHSLIAYLGALRGEETIAGAIALPDVEAAARIVLAREYEPSVEFPTGVDVDAYEAQLFERWGNSALGHRTAQVGTDGSVKLGQRIPEPATLALSRGEMPHMIALTVAAYLTCIAPLSGFDPGPHARDMVDGARARLIPIAQASRSGFDLAQRAIAELGLFGGELAGEAAFIARVGTLIDTIATFGVEAAIQDCVTSSAAPTSVRKETLR